MYSAVILLFPINGENRRTFKDKGKIQNLRNKCIRTHEPSTGYGYFSCINYRSRTL